MNLRHEPEKIAVAISTTGDDHRMRFLETSVRGWRRALSAIDPTAPIFVTVDGTAEKAVAVRERLSPLDENTAVLRVGQRKDGASRDGRLGVAVNKNTGLSLMMGTSREHFFLSDDDTYPLSCAALIDHIDAPLVHSMVCWGKHRKPSVHHMNGVRYAEWSWPRGVMLYVERGVVGLVGGMIEEFGPGGHEHVEWSRRIHQSGLTPAPYCSPLSNITSTGALWSAEDRAKTGENTSRLLARRKAITSVRRKDSDWPRIQQIMADRDGDTSFVPYDAEQNARLSATLILSADAEEHERHASAEEPGSQK